jgi:transcriptional regulator of acetoin/glycerol metabolism
MHLDVRTPLAERFQRRAVDLARQGTLGKSLKTYVPALREAYVHWVGLLDSPEAPLLLYGEKGAGKRRHVEEYFYLHNLYENLKSQKTGQLRVFRGDFVSGGFTQLLATPQAQSEDMIYIEAVDKLDALAQAELLEHLKLRRQWAAQGIPMPRLIAGTERALSLMVVQGEFTRELFQALTSFAVFMPCLQERGQDLPHVVSEFLREISGQKLATPVWLVDLLSGRPFNENLDELKRLLRSLLARKPDPAAWTRDDILGPSRVAVSFKSVLPPDASGEVLERSRIRKALARHDGDVARSAVELGLGRTELLQKMLVHGVR